MTFRFLTATVIANISTFCREINEHPGDVGTHTTKGNSGFPWREVRKLPKPNQNTEMFKYQLPQLHGEELLQRLHSPHFPMRFIEVSDMKDLYIIH